MQLGHDVSSYQIPICYEGLHSTYTVQQTTRDESRLLRTSEALSKPCHLAALSCPTRLLLIECLSSVPDSRTTYTEYPIWKSDRQQRTMTRSVPSNTLAALDGIGNHGNRGPFTIRALLAIDLPPKAPEI